MNYALQILRGRSATNTLKLIDGVNSIGRHDDCNIRIRSSQVSRRHCEVASDGDKLEVRDLGSSNGTFVNGKRVLGKQSLKPGDVLTIGGVTLRVDLLRGAARPEDVGAAAVPKAPPHDTAEIDALPVAEEELELEMDEEEFEIAIDDEPEHVDIIPLDDEPPPDAPKKPQTTPATPTPPGSTKAKGKDDTTDLSDAPPKPQSSPEEEDAVAQFLMDLKLDEED